MPNLADEELGFVESRCAGIEEQRLVGVGLVTDLGDDGGPSQPQVLVVDPGSDLRRRPFPLVEQDAADELDGDVVDEIPPRTIDDQAAVERHAGQRHVLRERFGVVQSEILLFAVGLPP